MSKLTEFVHGLGEGEAPAEPPVRDRGSGNGERGEGNAQDAQQGQRYALAQSPGSASCPPPGSGASDEPRTAGPDSGGVQAAASLEARSARLQPPSSAGACKHAPYDAPASGDAIVQAVNLKRTFRMGKTEVPVLRGVDLSVAPGEFVAIVGKSGSGKSTLLHLLSLLDSADEGEIHFGDQRIDNLPARRRDRVRNGSFGIVFQFYHLLPELTALENVLMPLMIGHSALSWWYRRGGYRRRAKELLTTVGLGHRLNHRPRRLSGGEMQRAAIARALIGEPKILFADEPTGNLDSQTGGEVLEILRTLNREQGLTIVMVTHDDAIARQAHRTVRLADGRIAENDNVRAAVGSPSSAVA